MNRLALRALGLAAVTAGAVLALSAPAQADTIGNSGLLSGNSVSSVIQVPVNVCGNAIGILGDATASCGGGASALSGGGSGSGAGFFAHSHGVRAHSVRAHSIRAHSIRAHSVRAHSHKVRGTGVHAKSHKCPGSTTASGYTHR